MSSTGERSVASAPRERSAGAAAVSAFRRMLLHPVFMLCLAAALCVVAYAQISGRNTRPIGSDGWGYYLPLPALFIYGDPSLSFLNKPDLPHDVAQYRAKDGIWQGLSPTDTGYRDKYAVGTSVMELPFFLLALAYRSLTHASVNGFEMSFQLAVALSGAFYFALGCYLIYRAACLRYSPLASSLALAFAVLATNLLYYASFEPGFSHVYGFCLISALVYLTIRRIELGGAPKLWEFVLFGFLAGAAVMVRPTNAVAALLYILFARHADFRRIAGGTLLGFVASAVAALPQTILWQETTGDLIYYSYGGEGFNFLDPQVSNYLISVHKGLFFWHPAYLVMILALIGQLAVRRFETLIMLLIVALNIYLGASWGDPYFGDSFGCRPFVEMTPLLVLPMAAARERLANGTWRWLAAGLAAFLIAINLVQFHGYMIGALPHNNTTIDRYVAFWARWVGPQAVTTRRSIR
jgi:hypothetical protein